jgi:hypothetical protein
MSGNKRTEAWDRTRKATEQIKPMAAQMKPLAKTTGEAAKRQWFRTRAWAAPRVERTGQVLQDTVAPKVSDMLSSAAERIDPAKPKRGRWRLPVGIAAAMAAAASGAAAFLRNRSKTQTTVSAEDTTVVNDMDDVGAGPTETVVEDKQAHIR